MMMADEGGGDPKPSEDHAQSEDTLESSVIGR